jgi:ribosomal protein S18 acetylase RimI-like enzyme
MTKQIPQERFMIRLITQADSAAVISLAVTSGLFSESETELVEKMLEDYFGGNNNNGHACIIDQENQALGVAYYAPAVAASRTWDLTMIAVRQDFQGRGCGTALLRYVENKLQTSGQRLLLVETSGVPFFERTRMFYIKSGYQEEARIRDFYDVGDDKVIFRKVLNAS